LGLRRFIRPGKVPPNLESLGLAEMKSRSDAGE
jgi:hypothetical protein